MGIYQGDERSERAVLALVAHDEKKDDLLQLAARHRSTLANLRLIATGHTGGQIAETLGLEVDRVHSGPEGGDLEIGARIVSGRRRRRGIPSRPVDLTPPRARHPGAAEGMRHPWGAAGDEPGVGRDPPALALPGDVVGRSAAESVLAGA